MNYVPFSIRFGVLQSNLITNDFPRSARMGLYYIFNDLIEKGFIENYFKYRCLNLEIGRICRDINCGDDKTIHPLFFKMDWFKVYGLIERLYMKLQEVSKYDINGEVEEELYTIDYVRNYFTQEINYLMNEENIGYNFIEGIFVRKGYIKTTKSINTVIPILSNQKLDKVRKHYMKALKFFQNIKNPDFENTIKECICALEASLIALHSPAISKNFNAGIRELAGNEERKCPSPIIESIIKIYGYRNSGNGVAHATDKGPKVSEKEAELIISLTADYITYFYSLLYKHKEEEFPF